MEAEILYSQFLHQFKAGIGLCLGTAVRAFTLVPLIGAGLAAEGISGSLAKGMPPGKRKLKPFLHGFTHHHAVGLIIMESKGIYAFRSFKLDFSYSGKIFFCHFVIVLNVISKDRRLPCMRPRSEA